MSGSGTSSDRGRGDVPDDPEVETVLQPSLDPEPPRAARGTSTLPALAEEAPVDPSQPSFDDRGDTVDLFENRRDQPTYVELDPFGADEHAAVTIDYRLDTPPEHAIGTGRALAVPPRDAPDEEPTTPRDADEVDELATYAVIVEARPESVERAHPDGVEARLDADPRPETDIGLAATIDARVADPALYTSADQLDRTRKADPELDASADQLDRTRKADSELDASADELVSALAADPELDASADELVSALGRGLVVGVVDRRSRSDSAELEVDGEVDALLGNLERELRATGTLSFATCEALRTDRRLRGLESCLAFLRCTVFAGDANIEPIGRRRRVQTCRLLLLSIAAHTQSPRWSAFQLEQMFEVALSIPGAELSDLVQALFALLVDSRNPASVAQARFIRELAAHVTGKRRRGHSADDFVWIAVRLADPLFPATEAQAFLAAHVLPRKMRIATRETILRAVRSTVLADEVAQLLAPA